MISYQDWKFSETADERINQLVNAAVGEIEGLLNKYIAKISPKEPNWLDKVSQYGQKVKKGIGDCLSNNKDLVKKHSPELHNLVYGTGKVPAGSSWWRHAGDRIGGYFNPQECVRDIQKTLHECGISSLIIHENNSEFNQLVQSIKGVLEGLGHKLQGKPEITWRSLTEPEMKKLKNTRVSEIYPEIESLIRSGVSPFELIKINPSYAQSVLTAVKTSSNKSIRKLGKELIKSTFV